MGAMGYPMAKNIRQKIPAESTLYINDVNRSSCERFLHEFSTRLKVVILDSAREVAEHADTIISIVPAADHVRSVYLDAEKGVIAARKNPHRLMLECSTIDCQTTKEVGEALRGASAGEYVDTPVSVLCPGTFQPFVVSQC